MQWGPGRPVHAAGSSALPARPSGAGRALLRRRAASRLVLSGAHSLCAHGRTNCTALRRAAARIFLHCWFFFFPSRCCLGVPAGFPPFFFPSSSPSSVIAFYSGFPVGKLRFETRHRPAVAPVGRGGGTATLAPRAASSARKMRLLRRWGPHSGGRERKPAAAGL